MIQKNPYLNKLESLKEMVEFLDAYDIQRVNQNDVKNLNILITINEIEAIILTPTRENKVR